MKTIAIVVASFWVVTAAMADDSCQAQATAKNLHGAALNSFAKSCCKRWPPRKNLHGAAETSIVNKCVKDATGS